MKNKKTKVAILSVTSNTILIILKIIAGIMSGSVSIISEAIHSGMDLVAALIAFYSVSTSSKPADNEHPYGHGKIENISGVIEGLLIFVAAALIISEAIKKIIHPVEMQEENIAMLVMFISAAVNVFVSRKLHKVAKETDSVALAADALHLKTDVYTSLGVGIGVLLIKLTNIHILDPIVAILVALLIIKEAYHLVHDAFSPLIDARLPENDEEVIVQILQKHGSELVDYHNLRTRKAGSCRLIDIHITVDSHMTVHESHAICDRIEKEIESSLNNSDVSIHVEPDGEEV